MYPLGPKQSWHFGVWEEGLGWEGRGWQLKRDDITRGSTAPKGRG